MIDANRIRIPALFATFCAPLFIGCFSTAVEPDADPAQVVIETALPGSPVAPARLVVTLASSQGDTLRDTVTQDGSRLSRRFAALDARPALRQTVITEYALAPDRRWTVSARLLDEKDSVQMADSASLGSLKAFERRDASLAPASRFASCPARVVLPASQGGRGVLFTRIELLVDGKVVRDSAAPSAFAAGEANAVTLTHDYLAQGSHHVTLAAWGRYEGESASAVRMLAKGGADVQALPGQTLAEGQAVALEWADSAVAASASASAENGASDATGEVGFQVRLGRVPTVTLTAHISGAIDL